VSLWKLNQVTQFRVSKPKSRTKKVSYHTSISCSLLVVNLKMAIP